MGVNSPVRIENVGPLPSRPFRPIPAKKSDSGNAAVSLDHRICVIDNVSNGFDIYRLDSGHFIRTLVTREPIRTYPKGVAFANNCQAIIGGGDHGYVYIFERKSGRILGKLAHSRNDGVQTIEVSILLISVESRG